MVLQETTLSKICNNTRRKALKNIVLLITIENVCLRKFSNYMRYENKIPLEKYTKRIRYEKIQIFRNIQGHKLDVM
jgi:hypothetical protein